ncbi:mRNA surveillance protein pelota [Methanolobus vulcani]|uniref:Protein pelota homolog n=1 Tax=Methanolobus vulcani TaxID=38026 RepID=A0A7Z8KMZ2_9EURY|nr:mRNA surveillance protein pelota [Methanolobus vulcani]TQD25129.1 mRNA surveillance protein pelota [Methanolobus vulcani]
MRVVKRNLKGREGEIKIVPETLDDLWHLKYIIEKGDLIFALTKRKADTSADKLRPEKVEKKTVRLGIRVEEIEFHKFSNRLRIHGLIEQGMDAGHYHTFNVEEGVDLSIIKNWKKDQIERIDEAEASSKRPKVVILAIEEGDADIGLVRHYGIELYSHISQSSGKRSEGTLREVFFHEIIDQLLHAASESEAVVVAGPGFIKDDFMKYLKYKEAEFSSRVVTEDTSSIGISGFQEVLKRGAVDRIMEESRIARESRLMDDLLKEISMDGKFAYGLDEVKLALDYGSIDTLLVADEMLRMEREKGDIDSFLQAVEHSQGKIVVFSTIFEPGQKLLALGGIAALLRFKI